MADDLFICNGETYGSSTGDTWLDCDQNVHVGSADAGHSGHGTALRVHTQSGDNLYVYDGGLVISSYLEGATEAVIGSNLSLNSTAAAVVKSGGVLSGNFQGNNFNTVVESGGQMRDSLISGTGVVTVYEGGMISGMELDSALVYSGETVVDSAGAVLIVSGGTAENIFAGELTLVSGHAATFRQLSMASGTSANFTGGTRIETATVAAGAWFSTNNAVVSGLTLQGGDTAQTLTLADTVAADIYGKANTTLNITGGSLDGFYGEGNAKLNVTDASARNLTIGGTVSGSTMTYGGCTLKGAVTLGGLNTICGGKFTCASSSTITAEAGTSIRIDLTKYAPKNQSIISTNSTSEKLLTAGVDFSINVGALDFTGTSTYYFVFANPSTAQKSVENITLTTDSGNGGRLYRTPTTSYVFYNDYILGNKYALYQNPTQVVLRVEKSSALTAVATAGALSNKVNDFTSYGSEYYTDYGELWDSTTTVSGTIHAGEGLTDANNLWLKIDTGNDTGAIIYGGGATNDIAGVANIIFDAGKVKAVMGGADNNDLTVGGVNLLMGAGADASVIYGAGRGNVTSNVAVNVSSGATVTGQTYGGGVLLSTATADLVIGGDVTLNLNGSTFGGDIVGGNRVNGGSAGAGIISGTVSLNVSGGKLAASKSVYGGGFAASNGAADTEIDVQGGVVINWNGGTMAGEAANGRGIFGGALAANGATAQVASVNIAVTDGSVTNVFGGGWSQSGAASNVTGDVNITISGGSVANVFGGGAHADGEAGTTSVGGDVTITVSGGTVEKIYATGQREGDEITGVANVVFTGSSDFAATVSGAGYQGANADATAYLTFAAYTGSFTGSVANFDAVKVSGETAATLTGSEIVNSAWNIDLAANTGTATLLTWSDAELFGDTVRLDVSSSNTAGWNLLAAGADTDFAGVTYSLYIDGELYAGDFDLDQTVVGGAFDGFKLYTQDNTLKFGVAAAV